MLRRRWLLTAYRPWDPTYVARRRFWRRSAALRSAAAHQMFGWTARVTYAPR